MSGGASYFPIDETPYVHVERGKTTTVSYALNPGAAIATTVQDRPTGKPVGGICVRLVKPRFGGQSAHMGSTCSSDDGSLEIGPFTNAETVQLYAYQAVNPYEPPAKRYGDQWVTATGGSGDQREASKVTLTPQQTITIPPIRVDPPGTITGTVRNSSGAAVAGVCAYPFAFHPGQGAIFGANCSNSQGRYTIGELGPYRWPVEFMPNSGTGYGWQWSGDVADRFAATMATVTAGGTATVDAKLAAGGQLTGKVTDGANPVDAGYVWTYNSRTGDVASPSFTNIARDGTFSLKGHRTQKVYVQYASLTKDCWYGLAGKPAIEVAMTAGQTTTIAADMTRSCGKMPLTASTSRSLSTAGTMLSPTPPLASRSTWRFGAARTGR
ncbi:carboxypeptidase-like regulatory domain-containing protein [Micromonospora sp. CPCC 205711]|uniref:carboxypeptidase-like regulatory domain-containing protein n=1 Tax=Micromonospora sp. CPCC 205547 TaxID=3122400 RepID=UPI002FF43896